MISQAFPEPAAQARAIGVWAGIGSVALPAGPLLGGMLVDGPGWRWVFLINVPVLLTAGAAAARLVPRDRPVRRRRLDVAGTLFGVSTLAAATYAVIELGRTGVSTVAVVATLVAGSASTALMLVERGAAEPMPPLSCFRVPSFSIANAAAAAMNLGTLGLLFVLTLYLQRVQDRSALAAGIAMLPLFLPLALLAPACGALISRIGPRLPAVGGLVLAAAGVSLTATWTPDTPGTPSSCPPCCSGASASPPSHPPSSRQRSHRSRPTAPASRRGSTTPHVRPEARSASRRTAP